MNWKTALFSTAVCSAALTFNAEAQTRPGGRGIGPGKSANPQANQKRAHNADGADRNFCVDAGFMESYFQNIRYKSRDMNDLRQIKLDSAIAYTSELDLKHIFTYMSVPQRDNCAGFITTEYIDSNGNNCLDASDTKMSELVVVQRLKGSNNEMGAIVHDLREDDKTIGKLHFGITDFDRTKANWRADPNMDPYQVAQKCEAEFSLQETTNLFKESVALMVQRPMNGLNQIWDKPILYTARKLQSAKPNGQ